MALSLGLDPGGTGRKLAHLAAAADDDDRLFVGHVRAPALGVPGLQLRAFPYLDAAAERAIEGALRAALESLCALLGVACGAGEDVCAALLARFGTVVVSVDACTGFAAHGYPVRHTESAVGENYGTPDERAFLAGARRWREAGNSTPLHQRVYWKLVGFALLRFFSGARTAAELAAAATRGLREDFTVRVGPRSGLWVFEAFPSELYRVAAAGGAMDVARAFARRRLVNLPGAPVHATTLAAFRARLAAVAHGATGAWARSPGRRVGDCLDAFAAMMTGPWAAGQGLRACGTDARRLRAEGAIVVPRGERG